MVMMDIGRGKSHYRGKCQNDEIPIQSVIPAIRHGDFDGEDMKPAFVVAIAGFCLMLPFAHRACGQGAQTYPYKTIRIVTSEPGSSSDFLARLIAQGIATGLGRQVIVDNRGGGMMAADILLRAIPDGYSLLLSGTSLWLSPLMKEHVPYDPVKDYAPITLAASAPNVLAVHPGVPVQSVLDLVALARSRPGELNYSSGSVGSPSHLAAELFKSMAGVNIVRIPYKGTGPAVNALLGGQVQLMFVSPTPVAPLAKTGKLRLVAVTTPRPSALAPGLPTVSEAGLPGYQSMSMFGIFAPAKTPAALIARLNREIVQVVGRADERERMLNTGMESAGSTAQEFAVTIQSDMARWAKVIKAAGIRME
jgi:tripartite-type tricarboxylate transporter receptor subunit TctC